MRRRPKSSSPAARTRKPAIDEVTAAAPKRAQQPLVERFHVAVDRQLKSGHATYEAAEESALAVKRRYPLLQVTVYDAEEQRHTAIEAPEAAADPQKDDARGRQRSNSKRRAVAAARR